jgi:hypothetical protein
MRRRLHKAITVITLSLVFSLGPGAPARGQLIGIGKRGRRVDRVVLPTPPFNPDAGILDGSKSRGRAHTQAAPPGESLQTFL